MTCLLAFAWMLDRVEPPWAVLIHQDGTVLEVAIDELPPGIREGDVLESPRGPVDRVQTSARRARNAARLRRLIRANPRRASASLLRSPDESTRPGRAAATRRESTAVPHVAPRQLRPGPLVPLAPAPARSCGPPRVGSGSPSARRKSCTAPRALPIASPAALTAPRTTAGPTDPVSAVSAVATPGQRASPRLSGHTRGARNAPAEAP